MLMLFSVSFVACSDDDDESPLAIEKEVEVEATAFDKWTYFSFKTGKVVGTSGVEETREEMDWDIAFHRYDIRTNSGTSGSGKGGAYLAEDKIAKTGWDALTSAPTTGYVADGTIKVITQYAPETLKADVSGSKVITGGPDNLPATWCTFEPGSNGPVYGITNQIFVVKTAEGKYAKVWLKAYQKLVGGRKLGGHITMKYAYQEDGSTKLN
jgi:hypothetical protein